MSENCSETRNAPTHRRLTFNPALHRSSASPFRAYADVGWYGQIIRPDSQISFLLEVSQGSPASPLAPTRNGLIKEPEAGKFAKIRRRPDFRRFRRRGNGAEKVLSYGEIAKQKIDVFETGVNLSAAAHRNLPSYYHSAKEQTADKKMVTSEWTEMSAGAESFAAALSDSIRFLVAGNREKLSIKKLYWKPGAIIKSVFAHAGEFAVVAIGKDPAESDFRPVTNQVFVFEYAGNYDIGEVEGLCVGLPMKSELLDEVSEWLGIYGKACFSPNDDYDYEPQEANFDNSISRLILDLQGDTLSSNWSFNELKTLIGKVIAESGENQNQIGSQIKDIEFLNGRGEEKQIIVRLAGETELRLRISSHTYLN